MTGVEAGDDVLQRQQDRVAHVVLVGDHAAAVLQLHRAAEQAVERGRVHGRAGVVAAAAAVAAKEREAVLREPGLVRAGGEPAAKSAGVMTTTRPSIAECSLPQYSAQNRWNSPSRVAVNAERRVAARHHVLLEAERRHVEAVDDVLRGHDEAHRLAERHVQLVDLAPAVALLQLPHPLLGDDVDRQRIGRRAGRSRRSPRPPTRRCR